MRSKGIQYYQVQFTFNFNTPSLNVVNGFLALSAQGKPFTMSLGVAGAIKVHKQVRLLVLLLYHRAIWLSLLVLIRLR